MKIGQTKIPLRTCLALFASSLFLAASVPAFAGEEPMEERNDQITAEAAVPGTVADVPPIRLAQVGPAQRRAQEAGPSSTPSDEFGDVTQEEAAGEPTETGRIADPLEPVNRFFFKVNDKLYFWILKPTARVYRKAIPEDFRGLFSNFYNNISSPIRIVNNLIQLRVKDAGTEFARLAINSTVGIGGLRDCAGECFGVRMRDADFGQTLGSYDVGQGFYLVWPVLGPSTARDTAGFGFDLLLYPTTWFTSFEVSAGVRAHRTVNSLSFHIGDYEALKQAAIDPYVSMRNAYVQNRAAFVEQAKARREGKETAGTSEKGKAESEK